jgi:hydroxymethylbilane synthase
MSRPDLIIGTRGSELALWQAHHVRDRLLHRHPGLRVELSVIRTTGDRILNQSLSKIGDRGLFTKEIEQALLDGAVDVAVHSLKDMPTASPDGLHIAAVTRRERVNDVLVSTRWPSLSALPEGASVATGSLRRCAQLRHLRPDLRIVDIRGNLNTRMGKFDASDWDGMILAFAGMHRLGWSERIAQVIPANLLLPAVGQGALGLQTRTDDRATAGRLRPLHHARSAAAVTAERALLAALEGGCQIPIGAWARWIRGALVLDAMVASVDGTLRLDTRGTTAEASGAAALGRRVAARLLRNGAREILDDIRTGEGA